MSMQNFDKPLAIFLSKASAQVLFHFFFLSATVQLPVCVCRTSKKKSTHLAAKCSILTCTCSSDYQLACVLQWLMGG